jgi:hypothetical protein
MRVYCAILALFYLTLLIFTCCTTAYQYERISLVLQDKPVQYTADLFHRQNNLWCNLILTVLFFWLSVVRIRGAILGETEESS